MKKQIWHNGSTDMLQRYVLGTAGIGGVWGPVNSRESLATILLALESGIQSIDTAPAYGDAELLVGKALRQWDGAPPRISTKTGRLKSYSPDKGVYDYSGAGMEKSLHNSLETMGLDAVDVLFLHDPGAVPLQEIMPAVELMIRFRKEGLARKIGLGGNYPPAFRQFIHDGVFDVVMEYNRLNACCVDALNSSLPECRDHDVDFRAASPLYMGLLGRMFEKYLQNAPPWIPEKHVKAAGDLKKIADSSQLSLTELSFRFLQNLPAAFRVVTGPVHCDELRELLAIIDKGPLDNIRYKEVLEVISSHG